MRAPAGTQFAPSGISALLGAAASISNLHSAAVAWSMFGLAGIWFLYAVVSRRWPVRYRRRFVVKTKGTNSPAMPRPVSSVGNTVLPEVAAISPESPSEHPPAGTSTPKLIDTFTTQQMRDAIREYEATNHPEVRSASSWMNQPVSYGARSYESVRSKRWRRRRVRFIFIVITVVCWVWAVEMLIHH